MGVLETIGLFWTVLATGVFTAAMLMAAVWSITLGVKLAVRRYKLGEELDHSLGEPKQVRYGR
jgi:hypothetical protein